MGFRNEQVKIVTWNMHRSRSGWEWLLSSVKPDIIMVQEAALPQMGIDEYVALGGLRPGDHKGTYLLVHRRFEPRPVDLGPLDLRLAGLAGLPSGPNAVPLPATMGVLAAADVTLPDAHGSTRHRTRIVSIYNPTDMILEVVLRAEVDAEVDRLKLPSARGLWLSDVAFDWLTTTPDWGGLKPPAGQPVVVGGDLNSGLGVDWGHAYHSTNKEMFDRLAATGWFSLQRASRAHDAATWFGSGLCLDYLMTDYRTASRTTDAKVDHEALALGLSDHAPVIATLQF